MPEVDVKEVFGMAPEKFRKILETYDYLWHVNKAIPDVDAIVAMVPYRRATVVIAMEKPIFGKLLKERGVPVRLTNGLTTQQALVVKLMIDPTYRRGPREKLKSLGIAYTTYRAWLRQPVFYNFLNGLAEDGLREHNGDALVALTNKAIAGDIQAIKLYFEVSGRHDPAKQQQLNVSQVLTTIFEVMTTHITDSELLAKIGQDFQARFGRLDAAQQRAQEVFPQPPVDDLRPVQGVVLGRVETEPDLFETMDLELPELDLEEDNG